jgi:hypothetical protein
VRTKRADEAIAALPAREGKGSGRCGPTCNASMTATTLQRFKLQLNAAALAWFVVARSDASVESAG